MATNVYLVSTGLTAPAQYLSGTNRAKLNGSTSAWADRSLSLSRGAGVVSQVTGTVTGPTNGIEAASAGLPVEWVSPPLDANVTISGTITLNLRASEDNMSANVAINAIIERLDSVGVNVSTIAQTARTTELVVTTETAENFTVTPTSTNMLKGDRLRIRVYGDDAGTMATGFNFTFWYAGTSAAASGDSYVTFTETIGFQTTDPTGSQIFPTDTASDVATASVDREAWTSRGAGVQTDVTNTVNGWTAPLQVTDTAGGTVVDWFTKGLTAFTLSGVVLANWRGAASSVSTNATQRLEVAVVNNDGTSPTIWGATVSRDGFGTSEAAVKFYVAGADLAVTDGQRLRLRFSIDDHSRVAAMATGFTVTLYYAGTSGGASGDTYITLPQSVTEYIAAAANPPYVNPMPQLLAQ
jgi:hypothetical protein